MGLALAVIFIAICFLVVMIATSVLENTGMERGQARLQALSAFFGTGPASSTEDPHRRKINNTLMILGKIGFIVILATVVFSIKDSGLLRSLVNLLIIGGVFYLFYWLTGIRGIAARLPGDILTQKSSPEVEEPASTIEEIFRQPEGYGLAVVRIREDSKSVGLPLSQLGLKEKEVTVLSIQRGQKLLPFPKYWHKLQPGDKLACYGDLEAIKLLNEEF